MRVLAAFALLWLSASAPAGAQGLFSASPNQPSANDKTGTDPLNLQQQIDLSNSYIELDTLYLNTTTYRHAIPLLHRRVRLAGAVPVGVSNLAGSTASGLGDIGADLEWTPWLSARGGLVAGVRTTWNTATSEGLGYGGPHTLMPYAQFVRRLSTQVLVAPFVGYRIGIGGDDFAPTYKDTLVGVTAVWRATDRLWLATTPQIVFDLEQERWYGDVGGEVGYLLMERLSTYVRPSAGFGRDGEKPYGWGITGGFRVVP